MKNFKKLLSIVMVLVMVFAMTATAFADANTNITVTVKFDTRSYDLSGKMLKTDGSLVSSNPVVEYTVSVAAGSTALQAVQQVATANGFQVTTKTVADYYDSSITHQAITNIGQIGETYIDPDLKDAFITLADSSSRGNYYVSGWVYGVTPEDSTETFPYDYMSDYTVSDGMTITMHFSVTGPYDYNTSTWTTDFSNPDVTMWNLYDQLSELDPGDESGKLAQVDNALSAARTASGNTTGLSAYYFSHNGITNNDQFIGILTQAINSIA